MLESRGLFLGARPTSTMRNGCNVCMLAGQSSQDIAVLRSVCGFGKRHLDCRRTHPVLQKALTFMNLQLHHVVSDVTGVTGMGFLAPLLARFAPTLSAITGFSVRHGRSAQHTKNNALIL